MKLSEYKLLKQYMLIENLNIQNKKLKRGLEKAIFETYGFKKYLLQCHFNEIKKEIRNVLLGRQQNDK